MATTHVAPRLRTSPSSLSSPPRPPSTSSGPACCHSSASMRSPRRPSSTTPTASSGRCTSSAWRSATATIEVGLALTTDDGQTNLVLLQSDPERLRRAPRAGVQAGHRCLRASGARAHAPSLDLRLPHRGGGLPRWCRRRRAGRHADAARRSRSAPGRHHHERQRPVRPRRVAQADHRAQAVRSPGRRPDVGRRWRAALRRPWCGLIDRRARGRYDHGFRLRRGALPSTTSRRATTSTPSASASSATARAASMRPCSVRAIRAWPTSA